MFLFEENNQAVTVDAESYGRTTRMETIVATEL